MVLTLARRPLRIEAPTADSLPTADGWMPGSAWADTHDPSTWICHHPDPWPGHTTLYLIVNRDDFLYIGITGNVWRRFTQHRATKQWWGSGSHALLQCLVNREVALEMELAHIQRINPPHNTVGRIR